MKDNVTSQSVKQCQDQTSSSSWQVCVNLAWAEQRWLRLTFTLRLAHTLHFAPLQMGGKAASWHRDAHCCPLAPSQEEWLLPWSLFSLLLAVALSLSLFPSVFLSVSPDFTFVDILLPYACKLIHSLLFLSLYLSRFLSNISIFNPNSHMLIKGNNGGMMNTEL